MTVTLYFMHHPLHQQIPTIAQNTTLVGMEGRVATKDLWDIHATAQKVLQGSIVGKKPLHLSVTMVAHQW